MRDNVHRIYSNREKFIVIGLTGKTGSGCTTVSRILEEGYVEYREIDDNEKHILNRKSSIIKKFASKNFINDDRKFKIIKPSTLMLLLLVFDKQIILEKLKVLNKKLQSTDIDHENIKTELLEIINLFNIIKLFTEFTAFDKIDSYMKNDYTSESNRKKLSKYILKEKEGYQKRFLDEDKNKLLFEVNKIFSSELDCSAFGEIERSSEYVEIEISRKTKTELRSKINNKLKLKREIINNLLEYFLDKDPAKLIDLYTATNTVISEKRSNGVLTIKQLQIIGDLVREQIDIFMLPKYVNILIKAYRKIAKSENKSCYIAIDSLKNPFEILFFKERYSAYYTFSIHATDEVIYKRFTDVDPDIIKAIHEKEINASDSGKQKSSLDSPKDFNSQNIIECIQRSDIYIDNNKDKKDTLYRQIFRYLSLIVHPGLVTPSKDEMIMQLALNAKFNSGCISRQVGAVVLNKYDSVKAIGWNDVPEGQIPCVLRSHSELLNNSLLSDYSKYERNTIRNKDEFKYIFSLKKSTHPNEEYGESNKKGLNDSFCFKSIQNTIDQNANQVYTRSLHAEENAFLQASKYGNSELIGGQLFTTASPCFLCAKKAYQLGMKRIVYIEAYPDISKEQVFDTGKNKIEMAHFRGAIGLAYQKLYEPIFSFKDELKAINSFK